MTQSNTCTNCANPIPATRNTRNGTCSNNCSRMANYYSKTPKDRAEMNKRWNRGRHERHLLPRVRSILRVAKEITPGSYLGRWLAIATLAHAQRDWKLAHALNYAKARDAMATLIGGHQALEFIEDEIAIITTEQQIADQGAASV